MSRGKFIPGGSRKDREAPAPAKAKAAAPAEGEAAAPDAAAAAPTAPEPAAGKGGKGGGKGGKGRPPAKPLDPKKKLIYGAVGAVLLLYALYAIFVAPGQKAAHDAEVKQQQEAQKEKDRLAKEQKDKEDKDKAEKERLQKIEDSKAGPFFVETTPKGAAVTVGTETKESPATFEGVISGNVEVKVALAKFEPVTQTVKLEPKKEFKLPIITLKPLPGKLDLASGTTGADYIITGPNGFRKEGDVPASLDKLPVGEYSVVYKHRGWNLPAKTVEIKSEETAKIEASFPYASIKLTIIPPVGAIIRDKTGVQILAKDFTGPYELTEVRPGTFDFLVESFGYKLQPVSVTVAEGQHLDKTVDLVKSPDFETSFGMQMIWVPAINGWAGRYEVTQKEFDIIMGTNPSHFKGAKSATMPVDSVGYYQAVEFCEKATKREAGGKLPAGYHFALPTNRQFDELVKGTDLDNSATARVPRTPEITTPLPVGSFGPNPQGLYDVIGNVNEWVADLADPKEPGIGSHRGGNFLTSDKLNLDIKGSFWRDDKTKPADENGKRPPLVAGNPKAGGIQYIGLRVVLVK